MVKTVRAHVVTDISDALLDLYFSVIPDFIAQLHIGRYINVSAFWRAIKLVIVVKGFPGPERNCSENGSSLPFYTHEPLHFQSDVSGALEYEQNL